MKNICIKDIYTGKPDAKDEIKFDGLEKFVYSYVASEMLNIDKLLNGNACFITGYKGTGKTALLFYLDYMLKQNDQVACTSFIFFKDEYTEVKKEALEGFSRRISSSIAFDDSEIIDNNDFDYIWRWLFFKRLISDNEDFSDNLFEDNEYWQRFCKIINSIKAPSSTRHSIIPPTIKVGGTLSNSDPTAPDISQGFEVDFTKSGREYNYTKFIDLLDEAEKELSKCSRTSTPYFILIDELEAYYGDERIFKRDLRFIRDLIFSVKRFNEIFRSIGGNTKMICSVRTEIINAISRFVISKEMNKVINGFEVPIIWNYNNTNSYRHPIIQILLNRIKYALDDDSIDNKAIYAQWFPEKIHNIDPVSYILNNGWNKPRDIVRLISSAQNSIKSNETSFNQSVFDSIKKRYSDDSLSEIREELRALYNTEDIETIISCFTGFMAYFTLQQLKNRISMLYANTILDKNLQAVLRDLYRLGFLGNCSRHDKTYRWQHKGDNGIILDDDFYIMIHYALHSALSIRSRRIKEEDESSQKRFKVKVTDIDAGHAYVEFLKDEKICRGSIHYSQMGLKCRFYHMGDIISVGEEYEATIICYNEHSKRWNMKMNTFKSK